MSPLEDVLITEAWTGLSADDQGAAAQVPPLVITGAAGSLPSRFAVEEVAVASVAVALLAAAQLRQRRGSAPPTLDRHHVAAAVRSERFFEQQGAPSAAGFAPLSRFWATADGWVRTHANYPWHRTALLDVLGTPPDEAAVAEALAARRAQEVEDRVFSAGGIAAAVRTIDAWRLHPQGQAVAAEPLASHEVIGEAPPRSAHSGALPCSGLRVLDLTRVIAGPVCTRYLAALGASVLRLDPPSRPDLQPGTYGDSLLGKRSAFVDLASTEGAAEVHQLLDQADVVVSGYRPTALDRFGLDPATLAERHPGLVIVALDAWGHSGPWAGRRGFDSVVQAPTGIAAGEPADGEGPGALPCQLLDHATGYLAAAAVLDALRRQHQRGGTHLRRLSLARTAHWLTSAPPPQERVPDAPAPDPRRWLVDVDGAAALRAIAAPGTIDGVGLRWPPVAEGYGAGPLRWPNGREAEAG